MANPIAVDTNRECSVGTSDSLGATLTADGVNFALHSEYATEVFLLLFDEPATPPTDTIKLEHKTDTIWHVHVKGLKAGQLYGYKVNGEYNPGAGQRFNPNKLLMDPYAKALTGTFENPDNLIFAYDLNAPEKDLVMDERDNTTVIPKCIVVDDAFNWQDDKSPGIDMHDLIIYETHVKGFTAHPSSGVKHPGTYLGFIEKIPYLKDLGITAVELMPVQHFYIRSELKDRGLTDYWGYNTIAFFAPETLYGTQIQPDCQVQEFKTLVRELHKAGIEVILDVVYNHTGEGNHLGPTLSHKGIGNPSYYSLIGNPENPEEGYRYYLNDTGCGNTMNIEHPMVMRFVLDSLRYWAEVMHVDGFRFDLASILARVKGEFSEDSAFFKAVADDPILSKVKMIAEPWDLTTYQVGNFPAQWSEWNGKYRDTARKFLKGDDGQAPDMARRLTGSADLYQRNDRTPHHSVNFITCHDGFTLHDLYAYNEKHNEANLEENHDGADDNHSWNCGVEGETDDPRILRFRKQMIKNALCCLYVSSGTPMLLYGDEVSRTQRGNNNGYCQDNELTWFNWDAVQEQSDIHEFCRKLIAFRRTHPILRHKHFFTGEPRDADGIPDITWFTRRGELPNWESPKMKTLCYLLAGSEVPSDAAHHFLFLVFNMHHRGAIVHLPQYEGVKWHRLIDTARGPGDDFRTGGRNGKGKLLRNQNKHRCAAYSVSVLVGSKNE